MPAPDPIELLNRSLDLTTRLDQHSVLQAFVESAIKLTEANHGAVSVLDTRGNTLQFVHSQAGGPRASSPATIDNVPDDTYVISGQGRDAVLGVPLLVQGRTYGHLYLADKPSGFTDDDGATAMALARAASIAVENSRLFTESLVRAQWIAASRAITTALLEGSDEEEALQLIANEMRRVARSDLALIILRGVGGAWTCEIADGEGAAAVIGTDFPPAGRAQTVIREGEGLIVDAMSRQRNLLVPELGHYGAALYAPMVAKGSTMGVIVLLRDVDKQEFDLSDLSMAESVAKQAALALELAAARHANAQAAQLEDRSQISRDLHDFAIQQLFASGLELTAVRNDLEASAAAPQSALDSLDNAINSIDESVGQIRQIIYSLRDPKATEPLVLRLRREVDYAARTLGFAPRLTIRNLGEEIVSGLHTEIDDEIGADIADDVTAVVRECLANAVKHARATRVDVDVTIENHRVHVRVIDDGQGISRELSRRSGLSNLAARARRHHGTFTIRPTSDGTGTKIEWMAIVE
ncbi:MAG: GAF domain-containing protein [Actinomycetaceae bacterium]|nr:GAF domain-containing protein [Actinomycetaceae bacterium]